MFKFNRLFSLAIASLIVVQAPVQNVLASPSRYQRKVNERRVRKIIHPKANVKNEKGHSWFLGFSSVLALGSLTAAGLYFFLRTNIENDLKEMNNHPEKFTEEEKIEKLKKWAEYLKKNEQTTSLRESLERNKVIIAALMEILVRNKNKFSKEEKENLKIFFGSSGVLGSYFLEIELLDDEELIVRTKNTIEKLNNNDKPTISRKEINREKKYSLCSIFLDKNKSEKLDILMLYGKFVSENPNIYISFEQFVDLSKNYEMNLDPVDDKFLTVDNIKSIYYGNINFVSKEEENDDEKSKNVISLLEDAEESKKIREDKLIEKDRKRAEEERRKLEKK